MKLLHEPYSAADLRLDAYLAHSNAAEAPLARARIAARQEATLASLTALTTASHAVELLRQLKDYGSENLTVCINHDADILADHIAATVERMAASLRGNGRIR